MVVILAIILLEYYPRFPRCDLFRKESKLKKATTRKQRKKKEFVQTNVYNVQNNLKILKSTRMSMMGFIVNDENKEKANLKKKKKH